MRSVFVKEIRSFFSSIVGYVALLTFLVTCGVFLWIIPEYNMLDYGYATMDRFFDIAPWMLLFLVPAITMRTFADEYRMGTVEWLSTKPLSGLDIILGKYLASVTLIVIAFVPTLIYVFTINYLSLDHTIDTGAIAGSYAGLFFLASAFAAIGLFCSSLTANQMVALLLSILACYVLCMGFSELIRLPGFPDGAGYYISMAGIDFHYISMSRGIIDTRDVVYFASVIVLFISLTRFSLNGRTRDAVHRAG